MRVLLMDDSLIGWGGHNAGYDFSIQDELHLRNIPCLIFGNVRAKDVHAARPDRIILIFHHYADLVQQEYASIRLPNRLRGLAFLMIANWNQLADLCRGASHQVDSGDVVVSTWAQPFTTFAFGLWLLFLGWSGKRVTFLSIFHNPPTKFFGAEWRWMRIMGHRHKLVLSAHNAVIANQLQANTGIGVSVLPLPFGDRSSMATKVSAHDSPSVSTDGSVTVKYLGTASHQRGFDLVVSLALGWNRMRCNDSLSLLVRFNCLDNDERTQSWLDTLETAAENNRDIHILHGPLKIEDYLSQLATADLVLAPYRADAYSGIVSGIFIDAVAAGKPVVVPAGSIMAQALEDGEGAGVHFKSGDAQDFIAAVQRAIDDLPSLTERATSSADSYRRVHSAANFVDIVLAAI